MDARITYASVSDMVGSKKSRRELDRESYEGNVTKEKRKRKLVVETQSTGMQCHLKSHGMNRRMNGKKVGCLEFRENIKHF